MIINHNMNAMNAHRQMMGNVGQAGKSMEKLSSGLRINRAGDDAAGLAISEKMRGQIRGLDQASRNAQDDISLIQTAEGALNETHSILQRMRELSVQSSNDTNNESDRKAIQDEVNQLADEIDRIGNTTEFNTKKLLNGDVEGVVAEKKGTLDVNNNTSIKTLKMTAGATTIGNSSKFNGAYTITRINSTATASNITDDQFKIVDSMGNDVGTALFDSAATAITFKAKAIATGAVTIQGDMTKMAVGESFTLVLNKHEPAKTNTDKAVTAQIGANSGQTMQIGISDMRAEALGIKDGSGNTISVKDKYAANSAISTINNAIENVSSQRSKVGAVQNRLEHTINNLGTASENLQASESRIRDVDMAKEMLTFSKNNILQQAAQAMLAQAKQAPQGVLQLLR